MAQNKTEWIPNAKQRKIVELLINPDDRRSKTQKMDEAGVPRSTFYRWMAEPEFVAYINSQLGKYTDAEVPNAWRALVNQASLGNVPAIKLFFEMKGMYSEKHEITGKDGGPIQTTDVTDPAAVEARINELIAKRSQ